MARRNYDPIEDAAVAREVMAAAGALTGVSVDDLITGPVFVPECYVVRHAAAVALVRNGWTRQRAVKHCRCDRKHVIKVNMG
ncbi:MAG: hypothetical protein EBS48_11535, partial [Actinobacteria bacterium]|nr:hypothetical protein [Actinomycetota bacterium]